MNEPGGLTRSSTSARGYSSPSTGGDASVGAAFLRVVSGMDSHVERTDGRVRISNPIRPEENFADRWEGDARKEVAFNEWLDEVKTFGNRLRGQTNEEVERDLADMLGESVARESVRRFSQRMDGRAVVLLTEGRAAPLARLSSTEVPSLEPALAAHRQAPPWPDRTSLCQVRVRGRVVGGQGAKRGPIESRRTRVLPRADLEFEAVTNAPAWAEYFWQVVNIGDDARRADDLRGGFERGERTRSESALYRGMHSIECFVVDRGICVGRSGPFFVRIGT